MKLRSYPYNEYKFANLLMLWQARSSVPSCSKMPHFTIWICITLMIANVDEAIYNERLKLIRGHSHKSIHKRIHRKILLLLLLTRCKLLMPAPRDCLGANIAQAHSACNCKWQAEIVESIW